MGWKSTKNTFVEESFTNEIDQTLNPGDKVVAVTTGYGHRVSVYAGVFAGVFKDAQGNITGTRVKDIPITWNERVFCEDGQHEEFQYVGWDRITGYKYEKTGRRYNLVPKVRYATSGLKRNRVFRTDTPVTDMKFN